MNIEPIATLVTPFSDKFTIPRQSGIVQSAVGELHLNPTLSAQSMIGLEYYSHIWVIWGFHHHYQQQKSPMVRPPRLGGNQKLGVFATRSSFRENNLALSAYEIITIDSHQKIIYLKGIDCLTNTPVFDIKPYLPYSDCIDCANSQFATKQPKPYYQVHFSEQAKSKLQNLSSDLEQKLRPLLKELLQYQVKPAYQKEDTNRVYASTIYGQNIKWYYNNRSVMIHDIN